MLKIGDKLICIKDEYHLIYNKIYTIIDVFTDKYGYWYYRINDNKSSFGVNSTWRTYFIPLKEIRKQKLNKIC